MASTKTILLRSGWQWVNIGDIAHTPGMLRLIHQRLPGTRVILWHNQLGSRTEQMLLRHFPETEFVLADGVEPLPNEIGGAPPHVSDPNDKPVPVKRVTLDQAIERADFCLHGSGPGPVGEKQLAVWHGRTTKPFGAIGITTESPSPATANLFHNASFIYTRETHSIEHLRKAGVTRPPVDFAPDASFACDIRNDVLAENYLKKVGLLGKKFICVIPRLRKTPYYKIYPDPTWTTQAIADREALNAKHAEPDHAKLREVMIRYVRSTGGSVLVCPEMEYQLAIQKPLLIDPLPDDVKKNVVNRDTYWLTDEAAGVYRHAQGLIGFECHSPILCAAQGVTGFYVRQPEDTIKGQMWYDLGLSDRIAEIMQIDGPQLADRFMALLGHPQAAAATLAKAMAVATAAYDKAFASLKSSLG